MNQHNTKWTSRAWDCLKRLGFSSLWLAAVQTLSWLACFAAVNALFESDQRLEWLVYGLGILLPFLWGAGGYWLLLQFRPRGRVQTALFLALWTLLPAALCWWAGQGGPDILWLTLYPQLMARLAWFYPFFGGAQSAAALNTLQPLASAGTHVLMMAGFAFGLWVRGRQSAPGQ